MSRYETKKGFQKRSTQPRTRRTAPSPTHTDPRMAHFWTLSCMDLGLTDVVIPVRFVHGIRDHKDNPLSKLQNGTIPCGFMRYRPAQGYDIQILDSLYGYIKLYTILHEARHVFQHKYKWWSGWEWQGERISKRTYYEDLPWEHDADVYASRRIFPLAIAAGFDIDNEL